MRLWRSFKAVFWRVAPRREGDVRPPRPAGVVAGPRATPPGRARGPVYRARSRAFLGSVRDMAMVAALVLLAYLVISFFYLLSFRVARDPGTVLVAAPPAMSGEIELLAVAFRATTGRELAFFATGSGESSPGALLDSGSVDAVFVDIAAAGEPKNGSTPAPGHPAVHQATLLAVEFPSPLTGLSQSEAEDLVAQAAGLAGGAAGAVAVDGVDVAVLSLRERTPDRQLLAVGGVYPTLESVTDGSYPLTIDYPLYVNRGPRGLFGLPIRLDAVREWVQPNAEALDAFVAWCDSDQARSALYGTPVEVSLTAVGDIWFARNVGKMIEEHGLEYPMELVAEHLKTADLTWCNLESPLGTTGTPLPGKLIWFRARPDTVECLKMAGIDVVALANNHILDYDSPCLVETLEILQANGLAYTGAGRDMTEARRPAVLEVDGLRVAFLAYTEYAHPGLFWDAGYPRTFMAGDGVPGCAPLDMAMVTEDVTRARSEADVVVVGFHWGRENESYPTPYHPWNDLKEIARETIDLGADLVIGTHPHAVQGLEVRGRGLIAYSLGNFVTDQIQPAQQEGLILEVQLGPAGILSARLVPVWSEGFRPRLMTEDEARRLLEKVEEISWIYKQRR